MTVLGSALPARRTHFNSLVGGLCCAAWLSVFADEFDVESEQLRELSPPPGTTISANNVGDFQFVLDPDLANLVAQAWTSIRVGDITSYRPHPAYRQATAQYGGKTALGDSGKLLNYVAGRPFVGSPKRDDPRAGERIAWNMRLMYNGDSAHIPEMHMQLRDMKTDNAVRSVEFEASMMRFMHRHVVPPLPSVNDNIQNTFGAFYMRGLQGADLKDVEVLAFIPRDDTNERRGWVYIPQLARSQNLAAFNTNETMFGSDYFADDFMGYSGRIRDVTWKYLGESFLLLPMYRYDQIVVTETKAKHHDYRFVHFDGRGHCFPNVTWQVRRTYIVEATTKNDKYPVAKRMIYVDAQTYHPALVKIYDRNQQFWKLAINGAAHPLSHITKNKASDAPIIDATSMIDIQKERCTTFQSLTLVNVDSLNTKDFDPNNLGGGRRVR
ncbi:MAG: DUF1329 domain-containing protein [Pseudomonadota bacterium]